MFGLTDTQKELFELEQYSGNAVTCLAADTFVSGELNTEYALSSVHELMDKNDIFHFKIDNTGKEPVWEYIENIDYDKYSGIKEFEDDQEYLDWVHQMIDNVPSVMEKLFSITVVRRKNKIGIFLILNHIIADAWTMSKIGENFIKSYNAKIKGYTHEINLNSYIDLMQNEKEYIVSKRFDKDKAFWKEQMDKCNVLTVLTNHPADTMKSDRVQIDLSLERSKKILDFCQNEKISEYVLYLSAIGAIFHDQTQANNFYIGSTLLNRTGRLRKNTLGLFANTVPIYVSYNENGTSLHDYINSVKDAVHDVFCHQRHTYNRILKENNIGKIFDVSLNYQSASILDDISTDMTFYPTPAQVESLIVHVFLTSDKQYKIMFDYQKDTFEKWEMEVLQQHMLTFIENTIDNWTEAKKMNAEDVSLITDLEKELVLNEFNQTNVPVAGLTIDEMFEEQVAKYPKKIAIILEDLKISYESLNRRANYIADKLSQKGIGRGDFVGINAGKKIETVVAILGTLKSGAAFVPVDPEYPKDRIEYILNDCKPAAILAAQGDDVFDSRVPYIAIGTEEKIENLNRKHSKNDVAYMIYTSGTTGRPKGVLVEHHGVESLRAYFQNDRDISNKDVIMQFASFSFDAAISEITMSILSGATMCIVTENIRNDIDLLENYLNENNVTVGIFSPQYLTQIRNIPFRLLITAGSESNHAIVEKFGCKNRTVYSNDYGPTEGTVCAAAWKYEGGRLPKHIPIGEPIANKQVYILKDNSICGIGVPGELCIAGEGIARGYYNQPEMTAEKFIDNPFGEGKLYRTGDRARWNNAGEIEFLGRIDNQVKIRGFRIEVAEIESIMRAVEGVKDVAVVVRKNELKNEKYLEAYYTVHNNLTYEELICYMRDKLPNYMIPSHVYEVTEIPLNRNDKVDTAVLEKYIIQRSKKKSEPETEIERTVLGIFQDVIGNTEIGMDDNFFEEGGDSIKAIGIVTRLKEKDIYINVKNIIQSSTIRELCGIITSNDNESFKHNEASGVVLRGRDKTEKLLALTDIQKEIYLGTELDTQKITYNVPMIIKFNQKLDMVKAQNAVNELQKRHISLQTGFINSDKGLVQFYRDSEDYMLEHVVESSVDEAFKAFLRPFDLKEDKLFRMRIAEIDGTDYMMFDSHHIVVDGLSMNILFDEFIKLYNGEELSPEKLDFDDYIKWSTGEESKKITENDLNYWEKVFAEGVEKTLIPTDYERNGENSNQGDTVYNTIDGELYDGIGSFCAQNNVTPFMLLMSVYGVLVHKLTLSDEVIIGVPTSGRFLDQTSNMVGMFVSSLPFKINMNTEKEFIDLVNNVGDNLLEILQHQNCTMNQMAERLGINAENGQNPFFATMFGVNDVVNPENVDYELVNFEQNQAKFDITFDVNREKNKWEIVLRYNKKLYKNNKMHQFVEKYVQILKQVVLSPKMTIRDIKILSDKEQNKLLFENNDNKIVFDKKNSNVVALFHEQVLKTPDSVAVAFDHKYMTYRNLNKYSNALADLLVEKGIGKGKVVPILTERSMEMLVMELAIMKTGAAFCPMDPAWPQERKELIIQRLNAEFILTGPGCHDTALEHMEISIEFIDKAIKENRKPKALLKAYDGKDIDGADTFYIIYTSGSTGEPKGVVVPYRGIINRLMWMNQTLGMKACSSVLLTTNYVYDSSIWQFYWPLINGGKSVIPRPQDMLTADYLLEIIEKEQIGIVDFVPSVFNTIVDGMESSEGKSHALDSLVWVILGGEEIKPKAVNRFLTLFPHMKCINLYGPTEASIGCIYKVLSGNKNMTIPIGKPISNVDILILDKDMNLVSEGICGEIYIGGICLADGYYGDKDRTTQSFIPNPFPQINSERLYKTGDLAKWDENGDIYYLGRMDSQVKIRGFRIELQEIEAKILDYPRIKECIVLAIERQKDDKVLCAYIVGDVTEADVKNYLTAQLPGYMVPSYYVKLDKIPISASGKANRKMLPMPDFTAKKHKIIEPGNVIEQELLEVWQAVLKQEEISMDDNYFEIGGDSIKALQMISMLRRKNIDFTMPQLFANPTIMQLAKVVDIKSADFDNYSDTNMGEFCGEFDLSPIQKRYFEKYDTDKHFNQAVVLKNDKGWNKELLQKILKAVIVKHPMLRATYEIDDAGNVVQRIISAKDLDAKVLNIAEIGNHKELEEVIESLQETLTPLSKVFECTLICNIDSNRSEYLMIAANHLVIDAVSMRILVKDIVSAHEALEADENCDLKGVIGTEDKTYKSFVECLQAAKSDYHFKKNNSYWKNINSYKDKDTISSAFKNRNNITVELNAELSESLLTKANRPYGTRTEELILAAILEALETSKLNKGNDIVLDMEAMGRNITGNELEFSETVGWFTAIYPVHFKTGKESFQDQIIEVKEKLRGVPDKGVGYQLIDKNSSNDSKYSFNYLGEFSIPDISEHISLKDISNKTMLHPEMKVSYAMDFSVYVRDGVIIISIDYVKDIYNDVQITEFKKVFEDKCVEISQELAQIKNIIKTPSDYLNGCSTKLSMNELQHIFETAGKSVEKIYPLSATQTGMLFHTIADGGNGAYFEQNYLTIQGNIDFEKLRNAYVKLIENNDIFRTVFIYDGLDTNYQVVKGMDDMEIHFEELDISDKDTEKQNVIMAAYCTEDKAKGFELQKGPLMRVQAFRITTDTWKLVWSDHHILMDGMCLAMILEKITAYYNELCEGKEIAEENVSQYGDYITWTQDQDTEKAEEYWKNEVIDFEKSKELYKGGDKEDKGQTEYKKNLDKDIADGLKAIAAKNGLTLNAVMQAAWAVTLMRYQDSLDVVYGSVVSGRSVPIDDVDRMIGLFISTLPIRIKAEEDARFIDIARQMMDKCANAEGNSYYPLSEIQKYSEYGSQLFDHIFVFENFDFLNKDNINSTESGTKGFKIVEASANESTNYDLTVVVVPRDEVLISFMYKNSAFTDEFMMQLMRHYINVLQQVAYNKQVTLDQIEVLDESDYKVIDVNEAFETGFPDVSIIELFAKQVEKFPDRIAIQFEKESYTYSDVDIMSNRIANTLLDRGIKDENIIGILMNKSAKAIISALGILKAGGAYMPLDPSYPAERLEFMIEDSKAPFVIIDGDNFDVNVSCQVIDIENDISEDKSFPKVEISPENLAYIIYTSGTTGKPKGAMIFHRNIVRLFVNDDCLYDFTENDVWVMFHSFCFDFSVWEMYGALLFGGKLIIISKDFARDTYKFIKLLETEGVTVLNQTPSAFNSLSLQLEMEPAVKLSVRYLIFGGEKLHPAVLKYFHERFENCKIINMYGITETTVHVTYKEITDHEIEENLSYIGEPIPTLGLALVDSRLKPVPRGMQGEIVVWGHGVCRGYLNRTELTAAKFLDVEKNGATIRIYRSGDAGRFIADGLEYIGRIDQQVKIRGHRIELAEIKNSILKNSKIEDCVVIVDADADDNKSIIAYYQLKNGSLIDAHELRIFEEEHLPAYMMPAHFIQIDSIPLNVNGKVDKKALPKPEIKNNLDNFTSPETKLQKYIAGIWEDVLNYSPVGLDDNYFEIGGDSIKVIKILSKVHADGYHFEVGDLFAHPTIREFEAFIKQNMNSYDQNEIFGDMKLTAIQNVLASDCAAKTNQYNQMVMLKSEKPINIASLKKALKALVVHHDALRSLYVENSDGRFLRILKSEELEGIDDIRVEDISQNSQALIAEEMKELHQQIQIEKICVEEQEKINLNSRKLYSLTLIKTNDGDYLFFVIHHMIVDVVSWNIIAEDLTKLYVALEKGERLELTEKTMSFKEWSEILHSQELQDEVHQCYESIWREMAKDKNTAIWNTEGFGVFADTREVEFDVSGDIAESLRDKALSITSANMEETLVAVTAKAVSDVSDKQNVSFAMESSGRFARYKDADLSRTVGWFTAVYPMVIKAESNPMAQLCHVKEKRRKVKDLEYSYGAVAANKDDTSLFVQPQISFNYLGKIGESENGFNIVNVPSGPAVGKNIRRDYAVDISCKLIGSGSDSRLHFTIAYSESIVDEKWVQSLKSKIVEVIKNYIEVLSGADKKVISPSDYNLDISMEELQYLEAIYGNQVESYVKMTPMQKGMLYHVMSNPGDDAYYEKFEMQISGEFSLEILKKALIKVQSKYPTLRTAFVSENVSEPVQIILREGAIDIKTVDARNISADKQKKLRTEFDNKPFVPSVGQLSKILLIQTDDSRYEVIWQFHHLILDGWSVSQVLEEIFNIYMKLDAADSNLVIETSEEASNISTEMYEHIGKQNRYHAKNFWKDYLEGREINTQIPFEGSSVDDDLSEDTNKEMDFYIDENSTKALMDIAKHNVTLASIVLSAWGLLLQMVSGTEEAVFGSVVSGRNIQIENVNDAVGMFINTVPVCTSLNENEGFIDSVKRLQEDLVKAEQYSYYPLYEIQSDINQGNPIISHTVAVENYPVNEMLKKGLENGTESKFTVDKVILQEHTNYSIGAVFTPGERLKLNLSYNSKVISEQDCKKLGEVFCNIIKQAADDPFIQIKDIQLLNSEAEQEFVKEYESISKNDVSLIEQFENAANKNADCVAVKDSVESCTYRELSEISNGLAAKLLEQNVATGNVVALMCGPGVYQAIGILGIMKANAVYLPIDTSFPDERIRYMLENSGAVRIVADASKAEFANEFKIPVTVIDKNYRTENRQAEEGENAYIIYTSGTTGNPKGVLVSKENIAAAISWRSNEYKLNSSDAILQLFAYSFDGFMTSFFTPIVSGAKVVFVENVLDIKNIGELIEREKITHFISVPMLCQSIFENLTKDQLKSLRIITTAGDRLGEQTYQIIKDRNPEIEVVNEYGPTECTVVSTIKRNVTLQDIAANSIGRVIDNGYIYIVDKYMHILPAGIEGEIVVGGAGVSKGYINAPELTDKVFVEDAWRDGQIVYRTGDKGKWLDNGEIGFMGRVDKQVKLRGYRIETFEIETVMESMEKVENAAVAVKGDELVAYYVGTEAEQKIKEFLALKVPKYMIPNVIIKLDKMPQTRIGKTDYKKLPEPEITLNEIIMPETTEEKTIWGIWENVLGHSNFGITDNFFDVGGNSIRLMSVYGQLNKLYPDKFTVASLFSLTTVQDICKNLADSELQTEIKADEISEDDILDALNSEDFDLDDLINKF